MFPNFLSVAATELIISEERVRNLLNELGASQISALDFIDLFKQFSPVVQAILGETLQSEKSFVDIATEMSLSYNLVRDYIAEFSRYLRAANTRTDKGIVMVFTKFIQKGWKLQKSLENKSLVTQFWEEFAQQGEAQAAIARKLTTLAEIPVNRRLAALRDGEITFENSEYRILYQTLVNEVELEKVNPTHILAVQVLYELATTIIRSGNAPEQSKRLFRIFIAAYSKIETFRPDLLVGTQEEEEPTHNDEL